MLATETGSTRQVMEMDYERYAAGEAMLGWLNVQGVLRAATSSEEKAAALTAGAGNGAKRAGKKKSSDGKVGSSAGGADGGATGEPVDGNAWLMEVAVGVAGKLRKRGIEVAHLKLSLTGDLDGESGGVTASAGGGTGKKGRGRRLGLNEGGEGGAGGLAGGDGRGAEGKAGTGLVSAAGMAAVQWVRNGGVPEVTRRMAGPLTGGRLLVNLRAEGDPDVLAAETFAVLADQLEGLPGLVLASLSSQHFRPGKPVPVHRVETV